MSSTKLLTVFGATGNQGCSVISNVLSHPKLSSEFKLRAITRNTPTSSAQALREKGVETVQADLADKDPLSKAIEGSYAVSAVTNYRASRSKEIDIGQGKDIAKVCKEMGVKHLIWSCLPNVAKLTGGILSQVDHFDSTAAARECVESVKGDMTASYFMPSFFMQNVKGQIKLGPDGTSAFVQPWDGIATRVPLIDVAEDTGKFVAGILASNLAEVNGAQISGVSQWASPNEIVQALSKATGAEVRFVEISADVFKNNSGARYRRRVD